MECSSFCRRISRSKTAHRSHLTLFAFDTSGSAPTAATVLIDVRNLRDARLGDVCLLDDESRACIPSPRPLLSGGGERLRAFVFDMTCNSAARADLMFFPRADPPPAAPEEREAAWFVGIQCACVSCLDAFATEERCYDVEAGMSASSVVECISPESEREAHHRNSRHSLERNQLKRNR